MLTETTLEPYLDALLVGDRTGARRVIEHLLQTGMPTNSVYLNAIWPIMVEIEGLLREGRITSVQEHLATRINRTIVDQLQNKLPRKPARHKKVAVCCAADDLQELGAQITADIFESDGWEVKFIGGGLTNEDILVFINEYAPDILLIYGATAGQAPDIRRLIDTIRGVDAQPNMRIMLSGGLFNRAEGLWEEIGADMFAQTAEEAVEQAREQVFSEPVCRRATRRKNKQVRLAELQPAQSQLV